MFVCVMALALSLSGYAAAAMSLCGGVPTAAPPSSERSAAAVSMERDANPVLIAGAHPCVMNCAMAERGQHASKMSPGDCPASGACGMVTAPAPQTIELVTAAVGVDRAPPPSTPAFSFFTGAPDRPPRALG